MTRTKFLVTFTVLAITILDVGAVAFTTASPAMIAVAATFIFWLVAAVWICIRGSRKA